VSIFPEFLRVRLGKYGLFNPEANSYKNLNMEKTMHQQHDILFSIFPGKAGDIGIITLNRPKQLNALTQSMCVSMFVQLQSWQKADNIKAYLSVAPAIKPSVPEETYALFTKCGNNPKKPLPFFGMNTV
jgi:hypothetical protein